MAIETCLFDLGDVLIRFSHDRMCRQIGEVCGRTGNETRRLLIESGLQADFERGRIDTDGFHVRWQEVTGRDVDRDALCRASGDIFTPQPGIEPVIEALRASGRRMVLLSNTCDTHVAWVRDRFPVYRQFDEYVLSYEVGSLKPEPAIYEAALEVIDCDPAECLYVDDRPENVEAGAAFGLDAVRFTTVEALRADLAARGLPTA